MVRLGRFRSGWGFLQRDVLFERLVITLHLPPSLVVCGEVVERTGGSTRTQIENARAPILVCEDLLGQQQREIYSFQVDFSKLDFCWFISIMRQGQAHRARYSATS